MDFRTRPPSTSFHRGHYQRDAEKTPSRSSTRAPPGSRGLPRRRLRKATPVFINAWSMGRDPSVWDAPEEFRPERFLGKDKGIDVKGHCFECCWKVGGNHEKAKDLGMEELYGLTTVRKFPLVAVMEPRLPDHLYVQL
ncbi:Flavonoid 3',5'-hydroxylase [Morus notabilis]|uniref:Flavonoid 3',5'-hydroxylase n=1 Tax=Morus notabilis TaxID=981085 RepID=W9QSG8_9ROSA|nr:Flavonoid 3',5'-hydroxylase [Morus notabilis]